MDNDASSTNDSTTVTTLSSLSHTDLRTLLAAIKSVPEFKPDPSILVKFTDHTILRSAVQAFTRAKKKLDDVTSFTFDNDKIASGRNKRLPNPKRALENGEVAPKGKTKRLIKAKKVSDATAEPNAKRVRVGRGLSDNTADEGGLTEGLAKDTADTAAATLASTQEHAVETSKAVKSSSGELVSAGESNGLGDGGSCDGEDVENGSGAGEMGNGDVEEEEEG